MAPENVDVVDQAGDRDIGGSVLPTPAAPRSFESSGTLDLDSLTRLMGKRTVNLVGILGEPESGKTAALVSLYLLVANARLKGWNFANSLTLTGFEDIARGSREWNVGHPPEQMTGHTHLSDDRRPGFLHLRLRSSVDKCCIDLALPDLPGEWTQALIRRDNWQRLNFLRSANVIWIFADGRVLANTEHRQAYILRLGQLAGRLHFHLGDAAPPVKLVLTHRDAGEVSQAVMTELMKKFKDRQLDAEVVEIASFARKGIKIKAGHGLDDLINKSMHVFTKPAQFWPKEEPQQCARSYLSYRRDR
ncbi:hypothetical protein [uncultured Pseudacidovorax sp.]|uniref:TRAFAC clade GTPase domain-containing protein n=1 Tax=uncultured Pseudacidovorax sp. TaxID=679313 RepID=UPI0025D279C9|nr:hypothetical protein [uncultured Pseudacidovorax sp.]